MFAQIKRRRTSAEPCPCGGSCRCHQDKGLTKFDIWAIVIFCGALIGIVILLVIVGSQFTPPVKHIQVEGRDCIVQHVYNNCTPTGSCSSHDMAVCPSKE